MKTTATRPSETLTVTSADGTVITVDRSGQGDPVVCVDGAMSTRSLGPGKMLAPYLADAFTVYTYDRRGRGDSGDGSRYEVQREIEDLAAVIAAAGGEAMVFGHSSGCVLALEAARVGLPITHLALYEPPCVIDHTRPTVGEAWAQELQGLLAEDRRGRAVRRFMIEVARAPRFLPLLMSLTPMLSRSRLSRTPSPATQPSWRPTRPANRRPSTGSPTCASQPGCCWAARARNGSPTQPAAWSTCCRPANSPCSTAKPTCSNQR